jgi:hypothetical protein
MALRVTVRGDAEVMRALRQVPGNAQQALVRRSNELAYNLLRAQRRAARADGRQAARAATTLRVDRGRTFPTVTAGPHPLLFGSEFGVKRRFGWYAKRRYFRSEPRQFKPHRGSASYWFFVTEVRFRPRTQAAWRQAADDVIRQWGA